MAKQDETIGQRVARAYRDAGMNRSQLQRALGVAYSTILNWEQGRTNPQAEQLAALSEVLGVSIAELLGETPPPKSRRNRAEVPAALRQFLASPLASDVTADERRTLGSVEFHGVEPTIATYHAILLGIRAGRRHGRSSRSPKNNRRKRRAR